MVGLARGAFCGTMATRRLVVGDAVGEAGLRSVLHDEDGRVLRVVHGRVVAVGMYCSPGTSGRDFVPCAPAADRPTATLATNICRWPDGSRCA